MIESRLHALAAGWVDAGRRADLVEVVAVRGSAPREAGTRMLVAADNEAGTLGGGHLEWMATQHARERLRRGDRSPDEKDVALGPTLGQCCGGRVRLRWRALDAEVLAEWPCALPRFHLQLHGAGHVGREIVRLLEGLECQVQWVDERLQSLPAQSPAPYIEVVCTESPSAEVATAPSGACYLVMTHRHDLDLEIVEAILRRGDARYVGLIGSRTKRARFLDRLCDRGFGPDALASLTCPVGLPGLDGKSPAVLAISVVAQLLQACPEPVALPTSGLATTLP